MKSKAIFIILSLLSIVAINSCQTLQISETTETITVSIISPIPNQLIETSNLTVWGIANINEGTIEGVYVSVNDGPFNKADGTTSWKITIDISLLPDGTNFIKVFAKSVLGSYSQTNSSSFVSAILRNAIYVSWKGSDSNPGTRLLPMKTIQYAIDKAARLGITNVYVEKGAYTPGQGLITINNSSIYIYTPNINLVGGWNLETDSQETNSELYNSYTGVNISSKRVIYVDNGANGVVINGFYLWGGNIENEYGGGILINANNCILTNISVNQCSALNGGGIAILGSYNKIYATVSLNTATINGGGIYIKGIHNIIDSVVSGNTAGSNGGGIFIDIISPSSPSMYNEIYGEVFNNGSYGDYCGGGGIAIQGDENIVNANVYSNTSIEYGGGVFVIQGVFTSEKNQINGNIWANSAKYGGGICLGYGTLRNIINANIYSNSATSSGGGIEIWQNSSLNIITNNIFLNTALSGGGIDIKGDSNTNFANVYNNYANTGGGIETYFANNNVILGKIYSNTATNKGSGLNINDGLGNVIQSSIYNNFGGSPYIGVINVDGSGNLSIINSYITNNWGPGTYSVAIKLVNAGGLTNLVISNCWIGGTTNTTGIEEVNSYDVSNHVLMNNKFITNTLKVLYSPSSGGSLTSITEVNDPSKTGATPGSTNNQAIVIY